jgi:cytochrome c-type biogenesis protein CcmH/NrfG
MLLFRKSLVVLAALVCAGIPAGAAPNASQLLASGHVDQAITTLEIRTATFPNDAQAFNLLCRAQMSLGNLDAGIADCQKAVALEPGNSEYHLWLGRVYGEKADHTNFFAAAGLAKKVHKEFEVAVELNPGNLEARADLAEFYVEAPGIVGGGRDKAEIQARELGALNPSQGHLVSAQIAEKQDDLGTAENEYTAAVQSSGGMPGTWLSLAKFYDRRGRTDEMRNALDRATMAPQSQRVLMGAAETLIHRKHDLPVAIALLRRYLDGEMVEDGPAFKAHYLLGTLLEETGDHAGAAEQYRAALALASGFAPAQNALRRLTHQAGVSKTLLVAGDE